MKRMILITVLLYPAIKAKAQTKDSVTLLMDYFDPKTGNKYGFAQKYDHTPTRDDTINFSKYCSSAMKKISDSLKHQEAIGNKRRTIKGSKS